jgi:hypothetical protein
MKKIKLQKLHVMVVSLPLYKPGVTYLVLNMQGKFLGRIHYCEALPGMSKFYSGWIAESDVFRPNRPLKITFTGALEELLATDYGAKPGDVYRMKNEEWAIVKIQKLSRAEMGIVREKMEGIAA